MLCSVVKKVSPFSTVEFLLIKMQFPGRVSLYWYDVQFKIMGAPDMWNVNISYT